MYPDITKIYTQYTVLLYSSDQDGSVRSFIFHPDCLRFHLKFMAHFEQNASNLVPKTQFVVFSQHVVLRFYFDMVCRP